MISDEERRRAVAELREASTGAYRHVDALDVIAGSVGVEVGGKFGHEVENETYAALADLIDRPTTHIDVNEHGRACCANCGCDDWCLADRSRYCPNCGAEVVG
ncbi:hypothetical protein [Ellagibacter isourolithinifaciens]|uniref:hypothetical protein n=1 Tax=Ellagibacter isourolithinifaciens TaxID=2137581 RepID=UPI003A95565C